MPSSTSPSKSRWPRLAVLLALTALAAGAASAFYTLRLNPEVRHFQRTHQIKASWAERITREHGSKVVVYGGSSCEFSIDGERLQQQFGLPCVNLGRGAGMGALVLTMAALEECRPGDTLVMALEPGLLTDPLQEIPNLGIQFALAVGHPGWIRHPLPPARAVSVPAMLLALRPGGLHTFTMLGKLLRRQPLYRYRPEAMHPSGWNQTEVRLPIAGPPGHGVRIPELNLEFLRAVRAWCDRHQVRAVYSLPWAYTPSDQIAVFQEQNARFLVQVAPILPVLKDERLGAYSVREHFSDTAWHLVEEAAARRSDELGTQLVQDDCWTVAELEQKGSLR